jgi:2-polyprenyl-3-methyl-5-hydroxy-6-metoxy-1,4-benzoquinol methylase
VAETNTDRTIKTDSYQAFSGFEAGSFPDSYRNLPIHAMPGLHAFVAERLTPLLPAGARLLDLGAGSGAMCARLRDKGFHVTAMDVVAANFRLHGEIPFVCADLNDAFGARMDGGFDGIVAVEILEHLENPRNFLRECHRLLGGGGHLVLSTPNVDNPVSKWMFLRNGTFQWFTDYNYDKDGHITPIPTWLLRKMLREAGFSLEWLGTYGNPAAHAGMARKAAMQVIRMLSSCPDELAGEITVAVVRKTT